MNNLPVCIQEEQEKIYACRNTIKTIQRKLVEVRKSGVWHAFLRVYHTRPRKEWRGRNVLVLREVMKTLPTTTIDDILVCSNFVYSRRAPKYRDELKFVIRRKNDLMFWLENSTIQDWQDARDLLTGRISPDHPIMHRLWFVGDRDLLDIAVWHMHQTEDAAWPRL